MTDTRVVVLVGSLRADSLNRSSPRTCATRRPPASIVEIVETSPSCPFYNEDLDNGTDVPAAAAARCASRSPPPTASSRSPRSTTAPCRPCSTTPSTGSRAPTASAPSRASRSASSAPPRRRTAASGRTPDTVRSAGIAGAVVVEDVTVSQSALEVDVLTDPEVLARLAAAVQTLVDHDADAAA